MASGSMLDGLDELFGSDTATFVAKIAALPSTLTLQLGPQPSPYTAVSSLMHSHGKSADLSSVGSWSTVQGFGAVSSPIRNDIRNSSGLSMAGLSPSASSFSSLSVHASRPLDSAESSDAWTRSTLFPKPSPLLPPGQVEPLRALKIKRGHEHDRGGRGEAAQRAAATNSPAIFQRFGPFASLMPRPIAVASGSTGPLSGQGAAAGLVQLHTPRMNAASSEAQAAVIQPLKANKGAGQDTVPAFALVNVAPNSPEHTAEAAAASTQSGKRKRTASMCDELSRVEEMEVDVVSQRSAEQPDDSPRQMQAGASSGLPEPLIPEQTQEGVEQVDRKLRHRAKKRRKLVTELKLTLAARAPALSSRPLPYAVPVLTPLVAEESIGIKDEQQPDAVNDRAAVPSAAPVAPVNAPGSAPVAQADPAQEEAFLSPDWLQVVDPEGKPFFLHVATRTVRWPATEPKADAGAEAQVPPAASTFGNLPVVPGGGAPEDSKGLEEAAAASSTDLRRKGRKQRRQEVKAAKAAAKLLAAQAAAAGGAAGGAGAGGDSVPAVKAERRRRRKNVPKKFVVEVLERL